MVVCPGLVYGSPIPAGCTVASHCDKGFEEWGSVLGDEVMAAALIDRLLHHCHIVNIRGNSYRMREHQDLLRSASEDRQGVAS